MIQTLKFDGVYRPEKAFNGKEYEVVAYIKCRDQYHRKVYSETHRGKTIIQYYTFQHEAQKVCDQLNNKPTVDPKHQKLWLDDVRYGKLSVEAGKIGWMPNI